MTFFRNRNFLEGMALGGICVIIIGSVIAFTLGESALMAMRRFIDNRFPDRRGIEYKYLY